MAFHFVAIPPFRLDLTAWALRRRSRNLIDRWDGATYRRVVAGDGGAFEVAVRQPGGARTPRLRVEVAGGAAAGVRAQARRALDRALGLRVDLTGFYRIASRDRKLAPLVRAFRGVKPPRFPTVFEALVNAIACQQLSLIVGLELLNRLAAACAPPGDRVTGHAFPGPADLAKLSPAAIQSLGFSRQKTRALRELATRVLAGDLDPERFEELDNDAALERLLAIRGIGRWSAEYVLLRGLGRLDVFPGDDVGARNKLAQWLGRRRPLDYGDVHRAVDVWQPYAGMVYFHMLLAGLADMGRLPLSPQHAGRPIALAASSNHLSAPGSS